MKLKAAAQVVADVVYPVEETSSISKSLAEHLREAPQKIVSFLTDNSKQYVAQALGLVKSYWPSVRIELLRDGMSVECDDDKFAKYVEEAEPVAEQIVKMLDQQVKTVCSLILSYVNLIARCDVYMTWLL